MSRWFRFYDEALNDPKILKLPDSLFRIWVGILCVASKNEGELPSPDDLALLIRIKPEKMRVAIESLIKSGLIDDNGVSLSPHNWHGRQYKSDVSTGRVKRFRNGKRNVSETPPDTEQIQNTDTEKESRSADAPATVVPIRRKYIFEGRIIKLDQSALDRWRRAYHKIPDIEASLSAADDYYSENPPRDGKWFFPVSRWLEKEHKAIVAEEQKAERERHSF